MSESVPQLRLPGSIAEVDASPGGPQIGAFFDVRDSVSSLKSYGEGAVMIWFLEDYRDDVVLVVRVQHLSPPPE